MACGVAHTFNPARSYTSSGAHRGTDPDLAGLVLAGAIHYRKDTRPVETVHRHSCSASQRSNQLRLGLPFFLCSRTHYLNQVEFLKLSGYIVDCLVCNIITAVVKCVMYQIHDDCVSMTSSTNSAPHGRQRHAAVSTRSSSTCHRMAGHALQRYAASQAYHIDNVRTCTFCDMLRTWWKKTKRLW
jgi:hypothetical protein